MDGLGLSFEKWRRMANPNPTLAPHGGPGRDRGEKSMNAREVEDVEMTASELVAIATKSKPNIIYRAATDGNSVAAWHSGRWIPVAGRMLGRGEWASIQVELLIDGKPAFDQSLYGPEPDVA